jgi:hypothetical protein
MYAMPYAGDLFPLSARSDKLCMTKTVCTAWCTSWPGIWDSVLSASTARLVQTSVGMSSSKSPAYDQSSKKAVAVDPQPYEGVLLADRSNRKRAST